MNMQQMLMQAQKIKRELQKAMNELSEREFVNEKAGIVKVTLLGNGEVKSIVVNPDAFTLDDKEMVEETIALAINETKWKIEEAKGDINEKITGSRAGLGM